MLFNSYEFPIFFTIVYCLYRLLGDRYRLQNLLLLVAAAVLNETLRWTRSTLAPFALVRLFSLIPYLLPVVPIILVVTICARAFPVACLSRRFDHAILLAFHGNLYHDSAPTALH